MKISGTMRYVVFLASAVVLMPPSLGWSDQRLNVLLVCIDDLRPELGCYGIDYIHSPNIDALAARSRIFNRHYVQAPTCGASRYTLLTGRYGGASNDALFVQSRLRKLDKAKGQPPQFGDSLPAWFRQHGYRTVSVGKVSHHPGGRGGADWDDDAILEMPEAWDSHLLPAGPWQHPRGSMHGLAHGEIRSNAKAMDVFQSVEGEDTIYPDGLIVNEALSQMDQLAAESETPFFLAVGLIRPHLPFGAPDGYMQPYVDAELPAIPHPQKPSGRTTWHNSGEFMKYNRWGRDPNRDADFATEVRKHYAACVSYADAQVGKLLARLQANNLEDRTIVVLWGDHGWHLGEHAIWGKHSLFEESLRSPLLIHAPNLESPGVATEAVVETLDVFPTLCDLAGIASQDGLAGTSLVPMLQDPAAHGHIAISYTSNASTLRNETYRLILHRDGFVELYAHRLDTGSSSGDDDECVNIAEGSPDVVRELTEQLNARLERK